MTIQIRRSFPMLEPIQVDMLDLLIRREFVTRQGMFTVLFGARPDADMPEPQIMDVEICRLRAYLTKQGISFETTPSGWKMPRSEKVKLKQAIERSPFMQFARQPAMCPA